MNVSIPGTAGVVVGLPLTETARLQLGEGNLADDRVAFWGKELDMKNSLGQDKYRQY